MLYGATLCECGAGIERTLDRFGISRHLSLCKSEASSLIVQSAKRLYGPEALEEAWSDFIFPPGTPFDESHPDFEFFIRWFEYDWFPEEGPGLAESLLDSAKGRVHTDVLRVVGATLESPYSYFQIVDVEPEESIAVRDIFRKTNHRIVERTASRSLERGNILYARMVDLDGISFLMGNGSRIISSEFMSSIVGLREKLLTLEPGAGGALSDDTLLGSEEDLRRFYFRPVSAATARATDLRNTDGDPLVFHTLRYEIPSFEQAFEVLRDLEPEREDVDLLKGDEDEPVAAERSAVIHWSKKRKGRADGEMILQAVFRIRDTTLVAEINSAKRADRARKEIEKRLGAGAVYLGTEITSTEGAARKATGLTAEEAAQRAGEQERLMGLPEVQAILKGQLENHWKSWPDTPIPALDNMNPREAAKDPIGRELLESLLLDFESKNRHVRYPFQRVDIERLRRKVGMT